MMCPVGSRRRCLREACIRPRSCRDACACRLDMLVSVTAMKRIEEEVVNFGIVVITHRKSVAVFLATSRGAKTSFEGRKPSSTKSPWNPSLCVSSDRIQNTW
eukprot:Gregarina_sp_Poly_1__9854@NODE_636_length_7024_cov_22_198074_g485_i0_p7_GENE_NODE_636_length_7024_cov_22_198074_g485_i0NODE_636_length_7024_cov_22_198074_g485_i0_p7_ORF_typecomplete_len102_score0_74Keratin_B2_2/PF13885_6/5_7Keratin_B2_2/PF13885_6/1_5e02_NODE_636_length_7024_cov_22_198074_g485_i031823487